MKQAAAFLSTMEAVIRNPAALYQKTSELSFSGRDTECAALNMVTRDLETCTEGLPRIRALGRNHTLWSILVKDLALDGNRLPEGIKAELIKLALWSMRYSTLAIARMLPAQPLIEVNRNIVEGLLAQGTLTSQAMAPPLDQPLSI